MSERDSYPMGVPCWVETLQDDPRTAAAFYGSLLGWQPADGGAADEDGAFEYLVARLRGRDVAGVGSLPGSGGVSPTWVTHVRVDSADAAAELAKAAGGTLWSRARSTSLPRGALPCSPIRQARCSAPGRPESARAPSSSTSRARGR
jgi:predicted enzyme related to lactoylglutathione lyase